MRPAAEFVPFVEGIARMTKTGEDLDGRTFIMENDDAVDTLQSLISEARELTGVGD